MRVTRALGEAVTVGENVTVRIVELQRGRCLLQVEAPRHMRIHRQEVFAQHSRGSGNSSAQLDATIGALSLMRRKNETVRIGDEIAVTVTAVLDESVELRVLAPVAYRICCAHGSASDRAAVESPVSAAPDTFPMTHDHGHRALPTMVIRKRRLPVA